MNTRFRVKFSIFGDDAAHGVSRYARSILWEKQGDVICNLLRQENHVGGFYLGLTRTILLPEHLHLLSQAGQHGSDDDDEVWSRQERGWGPGGIAGVLADWIVAAPAAPAP